MEDCFELFRNPTSEYRGKPFWAWNGELQKEELLRQIHVMKEMGFGGFFMHSRTGLETEYLGDEWFQLVNLCAKEAKKLGLEAWLYDEDRWPSGTAGGMVTIEEEFRRKYLTLSLESEVTETADIIGVYEGIVQERRLIGEYKRIDVPLNQTPKSGMVYMVVRKAMMKPGSFYNGYTDVDRLNIAATRRFLELTHERYKKYCLDEPDQDIAGIFTDEPNRGMVFSDFSDSGEELKWSVPWTTTLFDRFEKEYGYDILEHLPELFLIPEKCEVSKIKWQYMELLQCMFLDNFAKPVYEWGEKNKLKITGHVLHEDRLIAQTIPCGSIMRYYEWLNCPGIDVLTQYQYVPWVPKLLESAARQNGQSWKLSELYAATGWQMTFQDYKNIGDWQAFFGVNLRCLHLSWYTMKGEAKRDYPSSILHQSTWYQEFSAVEDYFSRINVVMTQGKPCCDTLVLQPVESVWSQAHVEWSNGLEEKDTALRDLEEHFRQLFFWICETQTDFDYGDEGIIAEKGAIITREDKVFFQIGECFYKRIIVSGLLTIRLSTVALLKKFQTMGGEIVFFGQPPKYIDCIECSDFGRMFRQAEWMKFTAEAVSHYFSSVPKLVTICENSGAQKDIYIQTRITEQEYFIFILNTNLKKEYQSVRFHINLADYWIQYWDCSTGSRYTLEYKASNQIELDFTPGKEYILYAARQKEEQIPVFQSKKVVTSVPLKEPVEYSINEDNICVLDYASMSFNNELLSEEDEVILLDRKLRDHCKLEYRSGEMIQPWFAKKQKEHSAGILKLSYQFFLNKVVDGDLYLVLEDADKYQIEINGQKNCVKAVKGFWIDICFSKLLIDKNTLRIGLNTIVLSVDYNKEIGLENIYIVGKFGVFFKGQQKLIDELPQSIQFGNLVDQGFPFYSGKIRYNFILPHKAENQRFRIKLNNYGGACVRVYYEDMQQIIGWNTAESLYYSMCGTEEKIDVEVVLNRRNTFGPLHRFPLEQEYCSPESFLPANNENKREYALYPSGLLEVPEVEYLCQKEYSSIRQREK